MESFSIDYVTDGVSVTEKCSLFKKIPENVFQHIIIKKYFSHKTLYHLQPATI